MASWKASEEGKSQIDRALTKKGWAKTENSEAIPEASRYLVLSCLREKQWTEEKQLNRQQLERCKLFNKNSLYKIFKNFSRTTYKKLAEEIESGELKAEGISYGTFNHFLLRTPIKTRAFKAYCEILGLNWEEIKEDPPQSERKNNIDTKRLSCRGSEVSDRTLALVEEYTKLFVGRSEMLELLDEFLSQSDNRWKIITAKAGFGKTALLANWVKSRQENDCFIAYHFFSQRDEITRSVVNAYRNLLQQLYNYCKLSKPLPHDKNELREALCDIVKDWKGNSLVVVLDGLDEADGFFLPPFPTPLPQNVFVIASARASEGEQPEGLSGWTNDDEPIHLDSLPRCAIADWLRKTGKGELVTLAQDETFVAQVCDRTDGIPLFLKYLIDELLEVAQQGEESAIRKTLAATPKGFPEYIRQQYQALNRLEDWRNRPDMRKIFYFLTIAKGELSSDDLVELMEESPVGLPWQVSRWFKIRQLEDCLVFSFAHSTLAEQFAVLPEIQANTKKFHKKLIKYCAQWEEYQSPYAFRHYAEHLRDVKHWEELYAIARNPDFVSTQRQHLRDEPDLPLKTVQTALLGAAEEDKAEIMAKFLLVHAHRLGQTNAQESPLDALRSGSLERLERAWKLAELYDIQYRVLWYLLLAWELKDTDSSEEARETLERLQKKELPRFSTNAATRWQGNYATYFLAYIFTLNKDICTDIVQQILEDYHRSLLCNFFSDHGDFDALKEIAISQSEAREFIKRAIARKTTEEIENRGGQPNDLLDRADEYAKEENFPALREILEEIKKIYGWTQLEALGLIAKKLAEDGQPREARSTFAAALKLAQEAEPEFLQALALADVAEVQVKAERKEEGIATASIAHQIAQGIKNHRKKERVIITTQIAEVLSKAGKREKAKAIFNSAIEIAQSIETQGERVNSFTIVAKAQVRAKEYPEARKTAQRIEFPWSKAEVFGIIAKAEAEDGKDEAQATLSMASEIAEGHSLDWVNALCTIALAQAVIDEEAALATFKELLVSAKKLLRERDIYLSKIAAAQAQAGEISHALETTDEIEDESELVKALSWIALTQFKKGKKQELLKTLTAALQAKDKIEDKQKLMQALKAIAGIQAMAGKGEEAVRTAETILTERDLYLPGIASWLVETGDRANFKKLLIPCAYYLDAAYQTCGLLARLYPQQAAAVAKVVSELN